ncbi:MAG: hypothetical protein M3458_00470 [Acidobacteriota bacterium]|nr:hypothetical protein [Acidobacteriota bacterium]
MRKLFSASLLIAAVFGAALAQQQQPTLTSTPQSADSGSSIPNMGRAPDQPGGIGRLDLRVVDQGGAPLKGVYAYLESVTRRNMEPFRCETWDWTDARGVAVPRPIHMGRLKLTLKAKGFQTQEIEVSPASLAEPVHVTMVSKK